MIHDQGLHDMSEDYLELSEHADERWLISYADMMTLLFGLFVLLYAMSDQFETLQKSAQEKFTGAPKVSEVVEKKVETPVIEIQRLAVDTQALRVALASAEARNKQLEALLAELRSKPEIVQTDLRPQLKATEQERDLLRAKLAQAYTEVQLVKNQVQSGPSGKTTIFYDLTFTLPDGKQVRRRMGNGVGPTGLQLDEPLPVPPEQSLAIRIERDGEVVEGQVKSLANEFGQTSTRLIYQNFSGPDRARLDRWRESGHP